MKRRAFLKTMGAGTLAFPTIVPSSVFGANAPGNRIVMAAIGTGGMGRSNLRAMVKYPEVQFVAVCDVDRDGRGQAKRVIDEEYGNGDCRTYEDFRELLAKERVDAVMHALPDHWHALVAIACARAGCDIYGEKPLARTIREGRAICDAVQRYGRVWQTGSWQRSQSNFRQACELVRNGRIGKLIEVEVGMPGRTFPVYPVPTPSAPPPGLNWDFWLGPAPYRPYVPFGPFGVREFWRWIRDYSGGQLTDWAGHHIDIAHWGMGRDNDGPVKIEGRGQFIQNELYNVPINWRFTCVYADGVKLHVADHGVRGGAKFIGERGWLHVDRGGMEASDPNLLREVIGPEEIHLYQSADHFGNFIECVRSRRPTITPVETAQRSISVGLLGEIAMLTGRRIRWNPKTEDILDDPGASALLGRAYREPWVL
jgi:predicted dehydrogenase